jgi:hypothetical protein
MSVACNGPCHRVNRKENLVYQSHVSGGQALSNLRAAARRGAGLRLPAVAGVGYVVAWLTGLAVWMSNVDVSATGNEVLAAYHGHQAAAQVQGALVEGVAAIALAVVVLCLGRAALRRAPAPLGTALIVAGLAAAAVSLVQCVLGQQLAGSVVPSANASRAGSLLQLIDRLDGVKMILLALMGLVTAVLVRRVRLLPTWLGWTAVALAAALIVSGLGYLLLNSGLAAAADASLPLLLLWICATGIALGRTWRRRAGPALARDARSSFSHEAFVHSTHD